MVPEVSHRYDEENQGRDQVKEVVVDIKYKRSKTNPNLNNSDFKPFRSYAKEDKRRCKVVYSSKGDLSKNEEKKDLDKIEIKVKVPVKKQKNVLTGWQTPNIEDDVSFTSTEHLTRHKGISFY